MPTTDLQQEQLIDGLVNKGYWIGDHFFDPERLFALREHSDSIAEDKFKKAGIGRAHNFQLEPEQRSDSIRWLSNSSPAEEWFLKEMDDLRIGLNRHLFLGLKDYECHFARYAPGAFYKKHKDAFRAQSSLNSSHRKISTVLYLNKDWPADAGGELVIYGDQDQVLEKVRPEFGRFVIFLSEDFPHEVLAAKKERSSIAGWMRALVS